MQNLQKLPTRRKAKSQILRAMLGRRKSQHSDNPTRDRAERIATETRTNFFTLMEFNKETARQSPCSLRQCEDWARHSCKRCLIVLYCSKECCDLDWANHRDACKQHTNAREDREKELKELEANKDEKKDERSDKGEPSKVKNTANTNT